MVLTGLYKESKGIELTPDETGGSMLSACINISYSSTTGSWSS
ncbi:hypothetical protein [Paenibacillus sp. sptzw28]|nr:hypothetical protein [Paenibacillus sp. sptzw28]